MLDMAEFEAKWQEAPVEPRRNVDRHFYTYTAIPDHFIRNADVSDGAFRVFLILLSRAWENSDDLGTMEEMALDYGKSVATFRKYLKELEDRGCVEVTPRGMGRSASYFFPYRDLIAPPETARTKKPV
jgi:response regulator of citrate/malate metabolism